MVLVVPGASDGVTDVVWWSRALVSSSWDAGVRVYSVPEEGSTGLATHWSLPSPALSLEVVDNFVIAGCVDGSIRALMESSFDVIGRHSSGVRRVEYCRSLGLVFSGSWDKTVCAWDPRSKNMVSQTHVEGKCFGLSLSHVAQKVVVADSEQNVSIYDVRSMGSKPPLSTKKSSLKHQTRCLKCFPDGRGYALSSVEGRVAVEHFEEQDASKHNFAFKCHRDDKFIYPVNALAFHPTFNTFATGGDDGNVFLWDPMAKRRLCKLDLVSSSIAALAFNDTGTKLAIADTFNAYLHNAKHSLSNASKQVPPPDNDTLHIGDILIHSPLSHEVMPKQLQQQQKSNLEQPSSSAP